MNPDREFGAHLSDWLEDGPVVAPERVLDTVLTAFPSVRQGRVGLRVRSGRTSLERRARALAVLAAAAIVLVGGLAIGGGPSLDGGAIPPSASASPTATSASSPPPGGIDTSAWTSFSSARYGFTGRHPTGWTVMPATTQWPIGTGLPDPADYRVTTSMLDTFASPDGPIFAGGSQPLPAGENAEGWLAGYEAARAPASPSQQCWPPPASMERTTIDGVPAWVRDGCGATDVFAFTGGRVYAFRAEVDPTLNRALFDAFLSTVRLTPSTANDAPRQPAGSFAPPS